MNGCVCCSIHVGLVTPVTPFASPQVSGAAYFRPVFGLTRWISAGGTGLQCAARRDQGSALRGVGMCQRGTPSPKKKMVGVRRVPLSLKAFLSGYKGNDVWKGGLCFAFGEWDV